MASSSAKVRWHNRLGRGKRVDRPCANPARIRWLEILYLFWLGPRRQGSDVVQREIRRLYDTEQRWQRRVSLSDCSGLRGGAKLGLGGDLRQTLQLEGR